MDPLKLENQLCFPLYAAAKEITRRYRPYLEPLGLTYTQYIAMMVFWEHKSISVGKLGEMLCLDSGTLTPMLKKMEAVGLIVRQRSVQDERVVTATITQKGEDLRAQALDVPAKMKRCVSITEEEAIQLLATLKKILK